MRIKMLAAVLMAGLFSLNASAGFEQFASPSGSMDMFFPGGGYDFSVWGLDDLRSVTTDDRTFVLSPNINAYDENDPNWSDGSGDGATTLGANTVFF